MRTIQTKHGSDDVATASTETARASGTNPLRAMSYAEGVAALAPVQLKPEADATAAAAQRDRGPEGPEEAEEAEEAAPIGATEIIEALVTGDIPSRGVLKTWVKALRRKRGIAHEVARATMKGATRTAKKLTRRGGAYGEEIAQILAANHPRWAQALQTLEGGSSEEEEEETQQAEPRPDKG